MKIMLTALVLLAGVASAQAGWVQGYFRSDGTYVMGYYRTDPDSLPYNNQSMPGNYNLNTGKETPGDRENYLNNYYEPKHETMRDLQKRQQKAATTWYGYNSND